MFTVSRHGLITHAFMPLQMHPLCIVMHPPLWAPALPGMQAATHARPVLVAFA